MQPAIIIHYGKIMMVVLEIKLNIQSWLNLIIFQDLNTQLYLLIIGVEHACCVCNAFHQEVKFPNKSVTVMKGAAKC